MYFLVVLGKFSTGYLNFFVLFFFPGSLDVSFFQTKNIWSSFSNYFSWASESSCPLPTLSILFLPDLSTSMIIYEDLDFVQMYMWIAVWSMSERVCACTHMPHSFSLSPVLSVHFFCIMIHNCFSTSGHKMLCYFAGWPQDSSRGLCSLPVCQCSTFRRNHTVVYNRQGKLS